MQRFLLTPLVIACLASFVTAAEPVDSVTQYGITWTFSKPVEAGQFITGDWWVVGPLEVTSVTPGPGPGETPGPEHQSIYGAASTQANTTMRNGSMIAADPGPDQGFDSRVRNYKAALSVKYPVTVNPGQTLISTISNGDERSQTLAHALLWTNEKQGFYALKTGAVLTVLDEPPPPNAFRPAFVGIAGKTRKIFTRDQVDETKLLKIPVIPGMPDFSQFARYYERPYIADIVTSWLIQVLGPSENQSCYGREVARICGITGLMLNSDVPIEQKEKLLVGFIQNGIDIHGLVEGGRREYEGAGGFWSGRKLAVMFAGVMLNEPAMINVGEITIFSEDQQTYYGEGWAGQKAHFQNGFHSIPALPYEHKKPETWDMHNNRSESYRSLNIMTWPATALVVRLMGLVKEWNHDAFIDYCDRVMSAEDPYAEARKETTVRNQQVRPTSEGKTADPWVNNMWKTYRLTAPEPEWAGNNRMWVWTNPEFPGKGEWQPNPKPAEPAESYVAPR